MCDFVVVWLWSQVLCRQRFIKTHCTGSLAIRFPVRTSVSSFPNSQNESGRLPRRLCSASKTRSVGARSPKFEGSLRIWLCPIASSTMPCMATIAQEGSSVMRFPVSRTSRRWPICSVSVQFSFREIYVSSRHCSSSLPFRNDARVPFLKTWSSYGISLSRRAR